jgi:hypothetical protein
MTYIKASALTCAALCLLSFGLAANEVCTAAESKAMAPAGASAGGHKSNSGSAGKSIDLNKTVVSIDTKGFAGKTSREILASAANDDGDEIIQLNGHPQCVRLSFDDEKVTSDNDYGVRHLLVYPLKEYAAVFARDSKRKAAFAQQMAELKTVIAKPSVKGVGDLPIFPQSDAGQVFHNQERYLKFKQGSGISFISGNSNGDPPLKNEGQFYCFEGMTNDGSFFVSFFAPIKSVGIPENAPIPEGIAYLGKLPRNKFTPDLDCLDKMMRSLDVH